MTLFRLGSFKLHSGGTSKWKIDLDSLDDEDLAALAMIGARMVGPFSCVNGIPRGGIRFEEAMAEYVSDDENAPCLIVDDVLTTGTSMETAKRDLESEAMHGTKVIGLVAFARGPCPPLVKAVFTYNGGD